MNIFKAAICFLGLAVANSLYWVWCLITRKKFEQFGGPQ